MKKVVSRARRRSRAAFAMMDLSGRTTVTLSQGRFARSSGVSGDWYAIGKDMRAAVEKQQPRFPLTSGR